MQKKKLKQQTQGKQIEILFQWSLKLQEYDIAQMYPKITVSPNCNSLAINDQINKEIVILGIPNKQILGELNLYKIKADVQTVSYSPDSQYLIVQYREFLLLNNIQNQKQLVKIDRILGAQSIKIKTNKTKLFLLNQLGYDAIIQIFDLTSGERTGQFILKTNNISYSPLGQNCLVMNASKNFLAYQIIIYNFIKEKKVKLIGLIKLDGAYNYALKFRKYFTVFITNNLIKIFQLQRFKLIRKIYYEDDDDIFYQSSSCYCNNDLIVIIFSGKKYYQINCFQIQFKKGFLPGMENIDYFYPYPSKIVKKNAREVEIVIYK